METDEFKVGNFTLSYFNEDYILITGPGPHFFQKKIAGGDFESILSGLYGVEEI